MDIYYTKSKPKVVDYNPLTHIPFYKQSSSPAPYSRDSQIKNLPINSYQNSPQKYPRSTSLAGKDIFSSLGIYTSRSASKDLLNQSDSPRFYKTRPKDKVTDPILGEVKIFKIDRPKIQNLDLWRNMDKISNELNYESVKMFNDKKFMMKSVDNIAGSLKKEVPFVPYVDTIMLRSMINS
jgi:hypothetical protein